MVKWHLLPAEQHLLFKGNPCSESPLSLRHAVFSCVTPTYTVGNALFRSACHRKTTHNIRVAVESLAAPSKAAAAAACPGGFSCWVAAECHPCALPLSATSVWHTEPQCGREGCVGKHWRTSGSDSIALRLFPLREKGVLSGSRWWYCRGHDFTFITYRQSALWDCRILLCLRLFPSKVVPGRTYF